MPLPAPPVRRRTSLVTQVSFRTWQRSSVVCGTAASPKGGAITEETKNASKGAHTAMPSQPAGKINVGYRDGSEDAFFPRRRSGSPASHTTEIRQSVKDHRT